MKNVYLVVLFTFLACSLHAQVKSSHAEKVEVSAGIGYGWLLNSNLSPYGLHYRGNYDVFQKVWHRSLVHQLLYFR